MSNAIRKRAVKILAHHPIGSNKKTKPLRLKWAAKGETTTKRRTEIIVEKHRVLTVSTRRISAVGWCVPCGMKVRMVTAEEASRIAQVTPRTIYRRAEAGQLHFKESWDGLLLICLNSLG